MEPSANHHLQVFVPEGDRVSNTIPVDLHDRWVVRLLDRCADLFEGATAYGRGVGVWKDRRGRKHWDRVTVIEAWINLPLPTLEHRVSLLWRDLEKMRVQLRQQAVGCILDGVWTRYERTRKQ